jgi:formate dehydrogenase major subunit
MAADLSGTALGGLAALGADLRPLVARAQELGSVCPYCSVGCATLVHTVEGKIVNIEGDPRSRADTGNRDDVVRTHDGAQPYHGTPRLGR